MSKSALEARTINGAQAEAIRRMTVENLMLSESLTQTSAALDAALKHMTELETENRKLRAALADWAHIGGRR